MLEPPTEPVRRVRPAPQHVHAVARPSIPPEWSELRRKRRGMPAAILAGLALMSSPTPFGVLFALAAMIAGLIGLGRALREDGPRRLVLIALCGAVVALVLSGAILGARGKHTAPAPASQPGITVSPSTAHGAAQPPASQASTVAVPTVPKQTGPGRTISARQWALIAKDPASHAGERIIVYGQVTQFDAATGTGGFRANVDGVRHPVKYGYADYETNTVLAGDPTTLAGIVEGDLIKATVTVSGSMTYATQIQGSATVPSLAVELIEVIGHVD